MIDINTLLLTQEASRFRVAGDDAHVLPERRHRPLVEPGVAASAGAAVGDPEALAHGLVRVEIGVPERQGGDSIAKNGLKIRLRFLLTKLSKWEPY